METEFLRFFEVLGPVGLSQPDEGLGGRYRMGKRSRNAPVGELDPPDSGRQRVSAIRAISATRLTDERRSLVTIAVTTLPP